MNEALNEFRKEVELGRPRLALQHAVDIIVELLDKVEHLEESCAKCNDNAPTKKTTAKKTAAKKTAAIKEEEDKAEE